MSRKHPPSESGNSSRPGDTERREAAGPKGESPAAPRAQAETPAEDPVTAQPAVAGLEKLTADLEGARKEAKDLFDKYLRLAADFENYKRRSRQDLIDRTQYANEELLLKLLPVLDNFRRALDHAPSDVDKGWFEGLKLIVRQFEAILEAQGVSSIRALGEKFDPAQHEAIAREETDDHAEGTVVEEMQRGYRLHEKVLRPTLVKVAQPRALQN